MVFGATGGNDGKDRNVSRRSTVAWVPALMLAGRRRWVACLPFLCVVLWLLCGGVARATLVYVQPVGTETGSLPPHRGEILAAADDGARPRVLARGFAPVISPNGRLIAFLRYQGDRGDLWTMGVGGHHQRRVLRGLYVANGRTYQPYAWSSDSRRLTVTRGPSVGIVTVRDRRVVDLTADAYNPSFSPDGRHLVAGFGFRGSGVELLDPRKPGKFVDLGYGVAPLWGKPGIAFLRGSTIVFVGHPRPRARARVLLDGRRSRAALSVADWSQGGSTLLAGIYNGAIDPLLIDPFRGTVRRLSQGLSGLYRVSRDGHTVLGQLGNDVVLERSDGTVKVLARNADSATWTA